MPYKNILEQEIITREGKIKIQPGATIYTAEEKENFKRIMENKSLMEQIQIDSHNHGGFTFLRTADNTIEKLKPETIGRLVYLSTYLDFDSQQLMIRPNRPMKKKDLQYFLGLGETKVRHFCDECIENGFLIIDENKFLYLNDIFFKGKTSDKKRIKLYGKTIRNLFMRMPVKHHRYFGYIILLLPHINKEWNILCRNPDEQDLNKIIPLTMKEICKLLNYNDGHTKRFKEAILKCCFEWKDDVVSMCGLITAGSEGEVVDVLIVNPHLIFYGTDFKKVDKISVFFRP